MVSKYCFAAAILAVFMAQSVLAIIDPTPDRIGIYFDTGADDQCGESVPIGVLVTAYIVLTNPTFEDLYGWEAAIRSTDNDLIVYDMAVSGGGVNTGLGAESIVAFDVPLSTQPATILATATLLLLQSMSECLILTGIGNPSIPEELPLVWKQPNVPSVIETSHLFPNGVIAVLGGCGTLIGMRHECEIAVSESKLSWGSLKSLYR